ncbi:hypothetical protein ACH5RR_040571 [Cinchona calisaya]|uniref:Uncharacterized protein n=1 Tax=Cinchona calisaya TaxID=153742 RepID=A0ABD2XX94_9GENT
MISIEECKAMTDLFSHVSKGNVLQERLPGLKDTMVILRPKEQQKYICQLKPDGLNNLDITSLTSLISIHPYLAAEKEFSIDETSLRELESNPDAAVKVKFVKELIHLSIALRKKVLMFCEDIPPSN